MILPLDEIGQFPISLIIIAIIINGIYNHSIYKFIVTFLFEKGLTNRQKACVAKKRKYFKRKTMRYIRAAIKSLPEQNLAQYREVSSCGCGFNCCFYNNFCDSEHGLLSYKRN